MVDAVDRLAEQSADAEFDEFVADGVEAGGAWIVLVTITRSMGASAMRAWASPASTPWVARPRPSDAPRS